MKDRTVWRSISARADSWPLAHDDDMKEAYFNRTLFVTNEIIFTLVDSKGTVMWFEENWMMRNKYKWMLNDIPKWTLSVSIQNKRECAEYCLKLMALRRRGWGAYESTSDGSRCVRIDERWMEERENGTSGTRMKEGGTRGTIAVPRERNLSARRDWILTREQNEKVEFYGY